VDVHGAIAESLDELRQWMPWPAALNQRSAAVAQRAGFTFEARLEHNRRDTAGELADSLCFVRLRDP
jgi:RimJ/RimL family protein N-acetyltransferase